jgi:hypothetical protein
MSTAIHEASHAACAIMTGRYVAHVLLEVGHVRGGEQLGHCRVPIADRIELSQLPLALIGYMSQGTPGWPPSFEDALDEELEALGIVLLRLGVDEETYEEIVEMTRRMLADADFIRLRDAIARALSSVPRLEREDMEALAAIHLPKEQPCST